MLLIAVHILIPFARFRYSKEKIFRYRNLFSCPEALIETRDTKGAIETLTRVGHKKTKSAEKIKRGQIDQNENNRICNNFVL